MWMEFQERMLSIPLSQKAEDDLPRKFGRGFDLLCGDHPFRPILYKNYDFKIICRRLCSLEEHVPLL